MNNTRTNKKDSSNNLAIYLKEINNIPLLNREEEDRIAHEAAAGNMAAREKLVNANLRFVVNIAKKFQGLGLPLEDLISEGNIGLLNAVDRFDTEKGCHFISYAVWWIRQAIMSALCEKTRMIRLPSNRAAELVKIEKAKKFVKKRFTAEAETAGIAEFLNMDEDHVCDLINISRDMLSLDNPVSKDKESFLKDFIEDDRYNAPEKDTEQKLMEADIKNVLDTLDKDEADIIRCHYGLGRYPMSLKEIGVKYNLSKERIRQIEAKALSRLQNPLRKKILQAYVA
ncbi:MAG: RNA polymerase sigma factor RpoD/SigA [Treponema sp.]|jgi:RNA polymerase primary sigma factor|nr:RNA polymerase sigma factor RpoD/SigA [Treponema sp.]